MPKLTTLPSEIRMHIFSFLLKGVHLDPDHANRKPSRFIRGWTIVHHLGLDQAPSRLKSIARLRDYFSLRVVCRALRHDHSLLEAFANEVTVVLSNPQHLRFTGFLLLPHEVQAIKRIQIVSSWRPDTPHLAAIANTFRNLRSLQFRQRAYDSVAAATTTTRPFTAPEAIYLLDSAEVAPKTRQDLLRILNLEFVADEMLEWIDGHDYDVSFVFYGYLELGPGKKLSHQDIVEMNCCSKDWLLHVNSVPKVIRPLRVGQG